MLRRSVFKALKGFKSPIQSTKSMSTVTDRTIHITFVDSEGNRAAVPALTGRTILDAANLHEIDLEGSCNGGNAPVAIQRTKDWHDSLYFEGPQCFYCHVQIPSSFNHLLPALGDTEMSGLEHVWEDEVTTQSRLACQIVLEKKHDGMVVYVPDSPPIPSM